MKAHLRGGSGKLQLFSLVLIACAVFVSGTCAFSAVPEQNNSAPVSQAAPPSPPAGAAAVQTTPAPAQPVPGAGIPTAGPLGITCPPEMLPLIEKTVSALMSKDFTFYPIKLLDPFQPFITPDIPAQVRVAEDDEEPVDSGKPLTPLQKMTLTEIESGLKAIMWGDLGRRAMVEDSTGKGYIVSVGTPAGEKNGVIKEIQNDRIVIQQELWNKIEKKKIQQEVIVKLNKKTDKEANN